MFMAAKWNETKHRFYRYLHRTRLDQAHHCYHLTNPTFAPYTIASRHILRTISPRARSTYNLPFSLPSPLSSQITFFFNHSSHCSTVQLELISSLTIPSNTTVGVTCTPTYASSALTLKTPFASPISTLITHLPISPNLHLHIPRNSIPSIQRTPLPRLLSDLQQSIHFLLVDAHAPRQRR